jgi:hypothetical protein
MFVVANRFHNASSFFDATFGALTARRFSIGADCGLDYGPKIFMKQWLAATPEGT